LGARVEQALGSGREACLCINEQLGMANCVERLDIEHVCPVCAHKNLHRGPMVVVVTVKAERAINPKISTRFQKAVTPERARPYFVAAHLTTSPSASWACS
jgi:hypothetical protein